ncbi:MAG: nucleotidyl transferase AbiEii/AbiGii toxin family protein [Verrucomicrobia bacterium]|nr:nucleotidyl transferase AbiEii/AbiGii toxin family protein [Verrucomicrobiota bacterium]
MDKSYYALKGGCNLRFFFGSPRFSEDMDLDVRTIEVHKLEEKVDSILESKPFAQILETDGLKLAAISKPKQTDTTQRWKFQLVTPASERPVPTKIEFSRREFVEDTRFESVTREVTALHQLTPVMVNHYPKQVAYEQKIKALVSRAETQARDVFDLFLLVHSGADSEALSERVKEQIPAARDILLSVDFDMFNSQVVSYLEPEYREEYGTPSAWENMQLRVIEALEG